MLQNVKQSGYDLACIDLGTATVTTTVQAGTATVYTTAMSTSQFEQGKQEMLFKLV